MRSSTKAPFPRDSPDSQRVCRGFWPCCVGGCNRLERRRPVRCQLGRREVQGRGVASTDFARPLGELGVRLQRPFRSSRRLRTVRQSRRCNCPHCLLERSVPRRNPATSQRNDSCGFSQPQPRTCTRQLLVGWTYGERTALSFRLDQACRRRQNTFRTKSPRIPSSLFTCPSGGTILTLLTPKPRNSTAG